MSSTDVAATMPEKEVCCPMPLTLPEFREFFAYNDWANDRLASMLKAAFGEETDLRAAGGNGGDARLCALQETAVHIFAAQAVWRARLEGQSPTVFLDPAEYPTPLAIRFAFGAERARFTNFLDTLATDADLSRAVSYATTKGEPCTQPVHEILQHILTHSMYHRGQVTARLIDLGHEAALLPTDLMVYQRDTAK